VRDIDGALIGLHRVSIKGDGAGLTDAETQCASLGTIQGGAIRLFPIEDVCAAREVVVARDIQEAASLGLLMKRPAWAAATTANLASGIVLPPEARRVVVVNAGPNSGARGAWFRFKSQGRAPRSAMPGNGAATFSEVVQHRNWGDRHAR
jgi:hypothetical protein